MSDTGLLLLALALVVGVAVAGATGVLGWILVGFLLACGAYLARATILGGTKGVLGGSERKKA
jgi:hypothetical protein